MKKYLFVLLAFLSLVSCSKDETGEDETATVVISNLQEDGEATFTIDGLLYTGVYKFKRR
jgi:hypothetical protein